MTPKGRKNLLVTLGIVVLVGAAGFFMRDTILGLMGFKPEKFTGKVDLAPGESLVVLNVPGMT